MLKTRGRREQREGGIVGREEGREGAEVTEREGEGGGREEVREEEGGGAGLGILRRRPVLYQAGSPLLAGVGCCRL